MIRPRLAHLALAALLPALAAAQNPFSSSQRWSAKPGVADWMPNQVAFAGDDAFVWAAVRGSQHSLHLYDTVTSGPASPRGLVAPLVGQFGAPMVAAGSRGDAVFALRQVEAPTVYRRAPLVSAFDPLSASGGSTLVEHWRHDMGVRINGPVRLATDADGDLVAAAAWDDRNAQVRIDLLDGTVGSLRGRVDLPALGLGAIAVSADGSRVAVSAGMTLYVLDAAASVVHSQPLDAATQALALSVDGGTLVYGDFGTLHVLAEFPGFGHVSVSQIAGSSNELPSRVALSADGSIVSIGWWNYTTGRAARLEMFDLIFQFALASYDLPAPSGATQNLVSSIEMSENGQRAAFGTWGNGSVPEVLVLELGAPSPVMVMNTPGSVQGLDLDASGTRVVVAHKDVHAGTFGSRGTIRLVDSGERKVQLLETPRLGGDLTVAARYPGTTLGWFLVGPKSVTPQFFPGVTGPLLIERGRVQIFARAPDMGGRIDYSTPIPNTPSLRGVQMHVQAAFRTPQGLEFTGNLVSPFLLD